MLSAGCHTLRGVSNETKDEWKWHPPVKELPNETEIYPKENNVQKK